MVNNLIVPLVILLFLFAVRVPFYIALFSVTVYLQLFVNKVGFETIFTGLYDNLMMPSILAVPFFILTGYFVEESSIGNRLVGLVLGSVSRIRSGPAVACVVANAIFGAISGSAPAATATIGKITFKQLEEAYDEKIALGLIVSSGSLSTIIPPSISMILYGIATEISIGRLFIAGFIPGIVIVIIVSAYFVFLGKPTKHTKLNDLQPSHKESFLLSLPVILFPITVLGGIYVGIFTPTEAGAVAAAYSFLVPLFIYKDFTPGALKRCCKEAAVVTSKLFIIIASSIAFAQALTMAQVPQMLIESLTGLSPSIFLVIVNIVFLIIGMFFEPGSAILILSPMLAPIASALGINPIHFGIVVCVNLAIGMFTPPFGLNLFVAQAVFQRPFELIGSSVPLFVFLYVIALALITYIPILSTLLPKLAYGG
jgi:C4-dicarboxylate transporter DctM subunit